MNVLEKILEEIRDNAKLGNMRLESIRIEKVEEIIRSHMSEIENDNWILCSERLPEDGTYLCTLDGELVCEQEPFTGMCGIENGKWGEEGDVIAWQPLPKPYRPDPCHGCFGAANNDCRNCDKT